MTPSATRLEQEGYDEIHRVDLGSTVAFVAVHAALHGHSFGGVRVLRYPSDDAALVDALLLARAMTRKVVLSDLPAGGAKTVVRHPAGEWPAEERRAAMARLGEFIESLGGRYHCGWDMGFTQDDDDAIRTATGHIACTALAPWTSKSVLLSMTAVCEPRTVAVQGLGAVGRGVASPLAALGIRVVASDLDDSLPARAGCEGVAPDAIYDVACDVFSPNAKGGLLDAATIPRLRCRVVCGAANNPLAEIADADRLHERGIVFVPDVLASAGAVIKGASDALGQSDLAPGRMDGLVDRVRAVIARAEQESRSPYHVALETADELIAAARAG